ncbi:hypothetical protein SDC9_124668 [bioreactor metagenome]|uniref:Uncharacterized protein n=1 Tax=bioreactor metagenome TaxID=1076179 RepID=A0A645CKZ2_9ZZZZ
MVGDEGAGRRAARDGVQNGRLHLDIAQIIQIPAQVLNEFGAQKEGALHLGVHNQVHIPLAVAQLLIRQPVELLRQGQQRLGQKHNVLDPDAHLAPLGAEHLAVHAHDVADVVFFKRPVNFLVHLVLPGVELDAAVPVLQIAEADLAHAPLAHETARDFHGLALHGVKIGFNLFAGGVPVEPGLPEGVLARSLKGRQLLPADSGLFAQILLGLGGCLLFSHSYLLTARFSSPCKIGSRWARPR